MSWTVDGLSYDHRKRITIQGDHVDSELTDFPVLVAISADTDIGAVCNADGYDIRFTAADGSTLLAFERESHVVDAGSLDAIYWVKVPTIAADGSTYIYIYYRSTDTADGSNSDGTWDANYKGVWHLGDGSTISGTDSSGTGANSTGISGCTATTGIVRGGVSHDGVDDYIVMGDNANLDLGTSDFSLSIWFRYSEDQPDNYGALYYGALVAKGGLGGAAGGYALYLYENTDKPVAQFRAASTNYEATSNSALKDGAWHHAVMTADRDGLLRLYIDGAVQTSTSDISSKAATDISNAVSFTIGSSHNGSGWNFDLKAITDEVRITNDLRSAAEIEFEYFNIANADHELTWGEEETPSGASPSQSISQSPSASASEGTPIQSISQSPSQSVSVSPSASASEGTPSQSISQSPSASASGPPSSPSSSKSMSPSASASEGTPSQSVSRSPSQSVSRSPSASASEGTPSQSVSQSPSQSASQSPSASASEGTPSQSVSVSPSASPSASASEGTPSQSVSQSPSTSLSGSASVTPSGSPSESSDYDDYEASVSDAVPYELHEFQLGDTEVYYRYADAPADVVYDGHTFTACYCPGSEIQTGATVLKNQTVVKVNWTNPFAWLYATIPPEGVVHYTRYRGHADQVRRIFVGDVVQVIFKQSDRKGQRAAEITIDPASAALATAGLVDCYGRQCGVDLYSDLCGVDRDDFDVAGTIDSVSGNVLTSTTFGLSAENWFRGGDILVKGYRRAVIAHRGDTVTVWPALPEDVTDEAFTIWPGCDHLVATCHTKFDNRDNFRGQPNIPDDDIWSMWGFL
jgi:hypothetical protein